MTDGSEDAHLVDGIRDLLLFQALQLDPLQRIGHLVLDPFHPVDLTVRPLPYNTLALTKERYLVCR